MKQRLTRRDALERCAAMGLLVAGPGLTLSRVALAFEDAEKNKFKPTPRNEVGPFYKKHAPLTTQMRSRGDAGMPLSVSGRVFDTRGDQLQDAEIEVWHTDHFGHYDLAATGFAPSSTLPPARMRSKP